MLNGFQAKDMKSKKEFSAGGIVYKKTSKGTLWLITQHSQHKGWVFPKGLVGDKNKDEKPEDAALREVEEEGGVKTKIVNPSPYITHFTYRWKGSPHGGDQTEEMLVYKTVYYFLMKYVSGDPKDHDWEMSDAKFVSAEDAIRTLSFDTDKKAFRILLKQYSLAE